MCKCLKNLVAVICVLAAAALAVYYWGLDQKLVDWARVKWDCVCDKKEG